jgi:plastocyanin
MKPGEAVSRPFPTAGTFTYLCSLHPRDMQGSVLVTPAG